MYHIKCLLDSNNSNIYASVLTYSDYLFSADAISKLG